MQAYAAEADHPKPGPWFCEPVRRNQPGHDNIDRRNC